MIDVRKLAVRDEVVDLRYEPAVDLGDVVKGRAPIFVQNPVEFFRRTYLTDNMRTLVIKVLMNLLGLKTAIVGGREYRVSSNLILLPSDLGGGKTHSLILLYHVLQLIGRAREKEEAISKLKFLNESLASFIQEHWDLIKEVSPKVIVIDCKYSDLAPSPVKPIEIGGRRIKTLWGYLGYELGRYEIVRSADENETAPYVDDLFKVLDESRSLILIDEIGRYYDQSGLEPTKISTFLMNLAEALSKYDIRRVSVVLSVPYEIKGGRVEASADMEYVHRPELVNAINKVLSRANVEIVKPIERQDLAEILRRRVFAHSREEFEKYANEFIRESLNKEYPEYIKRILNDKNFWKEVRETYPFHPAFLSILEKLAYKLPYLQRTRDAIKIAVQSVLALKEGLFDAVEDEISLIMPYHIPLFVSEVLDETILRNAPSEYKVFQLILRNNVVKPDSFNNIKKYRKDEFYEKIIVTDLRRLKENDMKLGVKLASIIWLHSLVGLGLPMNMGEFPTTADLVYSVSPTSEDIKKVLGILRSVLPQLIVHGDPESDSARWFFTRIPSVEELIEELKKNVTDEIARKKLAEILREALTGRKGKRVSGSTKAISGFFKAEVCETITSIPRDLLESRDPVLIILADKVSSDELLRILKGRNNLVVLAPYVEGISGEKEPVLEDVDVKGIKELAGFRGKPVWEGLLEMLRYYIAAESIDESHLKSLVSEGVAKGEEEYLRDLLKLLKSKVEDKRNYYYRHVWNLISRCYCRVYYYRQGKLHYEENLTLEHDRPIPVIVEEFLREKELIPSSFRGSNILSIVKIYLGIDPKKEPIQVGKLWNFILTTDKANVPFITYSDFINAIKELVASLDYAVRIKGEILWKPIFSSREKAERTDEGSELLRHVEEYLYKTGLTWDDIELIYWENIFDYWLDRAIRSTPENMVLKVRDRTGRILDIRDVKFDLKNTVKSGKLFYEEKRYPVELRVELPNEIIEGKEYEVRVVITVRNFEDEISVRLQPDSGLHVQPKEFSGIPPLSTVLKVRAERAGNYTIRVDVHSRRGMLDSRMINISVKGEWVEEEIEIERKEELATKEDLKVLSVRAVDVTGLFSIIRIAKSYLGGGRINGSIVLESGSVTMNLNIDTENPRLLELLWASINSIIRILGEAKTKVSISYTPRGEPELRDIIRLVVDTKGLKFRVRKKV